MNALSHFIGCFRGSILVIYNNNKLVYGCRIYLLSIGMFQSNINVYSYVSVMVHINAIIVNNVVHLTQITFRTFCMYTLVVVTVSILVSDIRVLRDAHL